MPRSTESFRLLPLAALVALLYGCAIDNSRMGKLREAEDSISQNEERSGIVKQFVAGEDKSERITLLPQSDGSKSSIVILGAEQDTSTLDKPFTEARVVDGKVVIANTSNASVSNRYVDTMASLPVRTFSDVIKRSVIANPEVQARWQNIKIGRYERNQELARFLPRVDFFIALRHESLNRPNIKINQTGNSTGTTVTWNIFDGFATMNDARGADYTVKGRFYDLLDISESTAYEAARAYMDVARYTQLVELARENLQTHQDVYDLIVERSNAGVDRRVDLELATGRLALAQSNLVTEQANLHDVSARYIRIVGLKPVRTTDTFPRNITGKVPADLGEGVRRALTDAPAVRAAMEAVKASQMAIYSANAAFLPKVDVQAPLTSANKYAAVTGKSNDISLKVTGSWNLYNGHGDTAKRRQLSELYEAAKFNHENVCREVRFGYEQSFNEFKKIREQLTFLEAHQLSTDKALQAYRQQFAIGQRTLLDVLDSQNEYFQAQRDYIDADYQLQVVAAKLEQLSGRLLDTLKVLSLVDEAPEKSLKEREDVAELSCDQTYVAPIKIDKEAAVAEALKLRPLPPAIPPGIRLPGTSAPNAPSSPTAPATN